MTVVSENNFKNSARAFQAILVGGVIAGSVDIFAAALINHKPVPWILHAVAGGLLAVASFYGGATTAWLGLFLQIGMSLLIATIFVAAALQLHWLTAHAIITGLVYGVVIFIVMNYVVMPLSAWHRISRFSPEKFVESLAAMLLFGLIVAMVTRRYVGTPGHSER